MKSLWQLAKILRIKENNGQSILEVAVDCPMEEILKYKTTKGLTGELKLDDARRITALQRRKLYATFKDISDYTGDVPEYAKELFKFMFCAETDRESFSLSNCSIETARELINYILEFVIENGIPLMELAIERTDDIGSYLYYCLKHEKCCICGLEGVTYTIDNDKNKMCLCSLHYDTAKVKGLERFCRDYKIYGIKI